MPINSVSLGWVNCFLGDVIVRVVGGGTPSRGISAYWMGNIPWASVKDFTDDTKYIQNTEEHISFSGLANSSANLIEVGIPVICTRMAVGRAAITGNSIAINQDLKALYLDNNIYSKYLLLLLKFLRPKFESLSIGSTVKGINIDQLLTICISLPPLYEQRRIAEILDTVDDTIARTSSLIIKLKQTKAGLLQDLLTRGLDDDGKLRDPQAHPEQFKDSLLGRIPKDWEIKPMSELADVNRGKFTHRPRNDPRFYDGSYPFIQTGDITKLLGGILTTYSQTLNERGITVSREFPINTIAITIAANIADTAILGIPMFFPDSVVGAVVKAPNSVRYVELCIRCAKQQLDARAPQSAQKNINLEDLRPLLMAVPEPTEQHSIAQIYEEHNTRIRSEEAYLNKLKLQKQGLMQDLLSGKVRVKNL